MCEIYEKLYYTITEEVADDAIQHEYLLNTMHATRTKNKIIGEEEEEYQYQDINIERDLTNYSSLTLKQLNLICDYYGITHYIRITKCKKEDIVNMLVLYESTDENREIVIKRKKMWKYLAELKNDKFMKKFIIQ